MASFMLPMMGAKGIYKLSGPWANDPLPNVMYTCIAIRQLTDITSANGDPYNDYYVPKNIDKSIYSADVAAGVSIVSLQADDNSIIHVPSSYIAAYPDAGGIPYRVMLLSITLGPIPDALDLSPVMQKIQSDVKDTVGVDATVRAVAVSNVTLIDTATAQGLENTRQANITNSTTDYSKYQQAIVQRDAALAKVQELQNYILAQQGAAPVPPPGPPADPSNGTGSTTT